MAAPDSNRLMFPYLSKVQKFIHPVLDLDADLDYHQNLTTCTVG